MLIYFYSKRCAFSSFSNRCWCPLAQLWTCTYQMNCFGLMHILCEKACQHETKGLVPRVWAFLVEFYSLWSQDRFRLHMSLFKLLCSYWFKWTDGKYINVKTAWFDNTRPVFICVKQRGIKREYIQVLFHSENGLDTSAWWFFVEAVFHSGFKRAQRIGATSSIFIARELERHMNYMVVVIGAKRNAAISEPNRPQKRRHFVVVSLACMRRMLLVVVTAKLDQADVDCRGRSQERWGVGMCRPKGYHFQAFLIWNRV